MAQNHLVQQPMPQSSASLTLLHKKAATPDSWLLAYHLPLKQQHYPRKKQGTIMKPPAGVTTPALDWESSSMKPPREQSLFETASALFCPLLLRPLSDRGQNCPNNQQSTCGKRGESRHLKAAILSPLTFYNFLPLLSTLCDIVDFMISVWCVFNALPESSC